MSYIDLTSIILMIIAMFFFILSSFKTRIIDRLNIYPSEIKRIKRPWGLKIKELKILIQSSENPQLKTNLGLAILFRRIGFLCLSFLFIILFIINPLFIFLNK